MPLLTDEQLLALLAHEMGHIENNDFAALCHRREDAMMATRYITGGFSLLDLASDEKLIKRWVLTPASSLQEEIAADQKAMELLEKAGKKPDLLLNLLENLPVETLKPDSCSFRNGETQSPHLSAASAMKFSPVPSLFIIAFFLLLPLCGLLHLHGIKGLVASGLGAALSVRLTRPWWMLGFRPLKRPKQSFRDPTLGNRAKRRADQRRHR